MATETPFNYVFEARCVLPWGETHGGSLGSEGRLDDTLDGVTVTEIRTKRAVLEDGVDEQPGSD